MIKFIVIIFVISQLNNNSIVCSNPTTRSNLISVPVLPSGQSCDNCHQQKSNNNAHMDQAKGFFPLCFKLPTIIPKNDAQN